MDNNGDFSSPEWDSGKTEGRTRITVPAGRLRAKTRYYWRVRYKDNLGAWSPWSDRGTFVTGSKGILVPAFEEKEEWASAVTVEGNSLWNRYAYFSWDNRNAVIHTWKVDANGNGDPRDDENLILWNGQSGVVNGITFGCDKGIQAADSGWTVKAYQASNGNGVVKFSRSVGATEVHIKYTLTPDSGDLYGELTLTSDRFCTFTWGLHMMNSLWVMSQPGEMILYDGAYLNGRMITPRSLAMSQEPVEGVDYLVARGVRTGLAGLLSRAKGCQMAMLLQLAMVDVDMCAAVSMASPYGGWPFLRAAAVEGQVVVGEPLKLRAVFTASATPPASGE